MTEYAIETVNLTKEFTRKTPLSRPNVGLACGVNEGHGERFLALDEVNLGVKPGELFGLLGPNGAGKTTLIKILCTILAPTRGEALVNGFSVERESKRVKSQIGAVLDFGQGWYGRLTGRQNLRFYADLSLVPGGEVRHRLNDVLELTDMSQKADDWYQKLSTGERRRLDIARAIIPDPSMLLLDEPTLGIDVVSAHKLRGFIRDELCRKEGKTVLLATHNMGEAEELCDKVAIIDHGKIIACDQPTGIMQLIQPTAFLEIEALNTSDRTISEIEAMEGVTELSVIDRSGNRTRLRAGVTSPDAVGSRICRGIIGAGGDILLMNRHLPSLEESFLRLIGESES